MKTAIEIEAILSLLKPPYGLVHGPTNQVYVYTPRWIIGRCSCGFEWNYMGIPPKECPKCGLPIP